MTYNHYSIALADGSSTGAYAAGPQDALGQFYAEDVNGDQLDVIGIWLTGNETVGWLEWAGVPE